MTEAAPPPAPLPPIPVGRRLVRILARLWPLATWLASVALALWLYFGESFHGHALAFAEVVEVRVAPAVAGRLATLAVEVGRPVRTGDVVATLDSADLDARVRLAKAEIERMKARLEAEREGIRLDESDRRSQAAARRSAYEAESARLRSRVEQLTADQAADRAEIAAAAPQIERLRPLVEKNLVTADRLETLVARTAVLEKHVAARDEQMMAARNAIAAWAALEPARAPESSTAARLLPFEQTIREQELRIADFDLERGKYRVTAPADGTVYLVSARPGEWVAVGAEIAQIVIPRPGRVTAYVTDRQIPAVEVGTLATLWSHDYPGTTLEGRVVEAGPQIEAVPLRLRFLPTLPPWGRLLTILVDKPHDLLPGQIYDVRFR